MAAPAHLISGADQNVMDALFESDEGHPPQRGVLRLAGNHVNNVVLARDPVGDRPDGCDLVALGQVDGTEVEVLDGVAVVEPLGNRGADLRRCCAAAEQPGQRTGCDHSQDESVHWNASSNDESGGPSDKC